MTDPTTDREELAKVLAERAQSYAGGAPEPEPEELLDYLAGRLSPEAEDRVRRRLVASPEAARALLDLADLEAAREGAAVAAGATDADAPPPVDLAARAGWRDLQRRLRPTAGERARPAAGAEARRRGWLTPALGALAASFLLLSVGLGVRVARLESDRDRPIGNLTYLALAPATRGDLPEKALAAGGHLLLLLSPEESCETYAATVARPGGAPWNVEGLVQDDLGRLSIELPWTEAGAYALELSGCAPRRALATYGFRITRPASQAPGSDAR